ncbi:EamA family transporter [Rhodoferax sp.]|uniref:EamA family transporter n=1 Tax=Rhodoferax sp. TaxID=50421 RepID=UPI00271BA591|nr:EamA family transporter [Rhodoferax sp.]MDO9198349.1 EamA family transporter [Rhodoferax sp.]
MINSAALAVAASVVMHVTWNLIARHQARDAYPLWWVLLAHLVLLGPWGLYSLFTDVQWTPTLVKWVLISASANVVYFMGLRRAYECAPVAFVYPLVRSSPVLIALWSMLFLGETMGVFAWTGLLVSILGLLVLARVGGNAQDIRALPWALVAMFATSIYSLTDRAATAHIPSFGGLVGFITIGYFASWLALTVDLRRTNGAWRPNVRIGLPVAVVGGLCIGLAYALVIHAMRSMPAAIVVAFTNAGIVLASGASILVFKERAAWKARASAAFIICAGLLMLSIRS